MFTFTTGFLGNEVPILSGISIPCFEIKSHFMDYQCYNHGGSGAQTPCLGEF